jgi:malonate-semialdehyde dehydrogenase (acetylating)/methylmalonate-semialdehyde dehydrogenase
VRGMTVAREEIFGPVLNVMRMADLGRRHRSGQQVALRQRRLDLHPLRQGAAREFKHRVKAGMVGINIGVPASMAMVSLQRLGRILLRRPAHARPEACSSSPSKK